jgi:hypothetical protein
VREKKSLKTRFYPLPLFGLSQSLPALSAACTSPCQHQTSMGESIPASMRQHGKEKTRESGLLLSHGLSFSITPVK